MVSHSSLKRGPRLANGHGLRHVVHHGRKTPESPCRFGDDAAGRLVAADPLARAGWKGANVAVDGQWILRRSIHQERGDTGRIEGPAHQSGCEQRPNLAREDQAMLVCGDVKRFDADRIAGQQHPA